jgi:hypothetical protein
VGHRTLRSSLSALATRAPAVAVAALALLALITAPASAASSDRALVNEYAGIEEAHLGEKLPGGPASFIKVIDSPKYSKTEHLYGKTFTGGAGTKVQWNAGGSEAIGAVITVYRIARSKGPGVQRGTIAHEVFHVFEARLSVSRGIDDSHEGWLDEGAATWVESELVPNDETVRSEWREYLRSPTTPLFKRAYEAVGFFGHMLYEGISPWTRFKAMFTTTSSAAAYGAAISSSVKFLQDEASVFFRERALGSEWDQSGRNVPSAGEVGFKPPPVTISATSHSPLTAAPHADTAVVVSIATLPRATPFLEVTIVKGHARLHSSSGVNVVDPDKLLFCSEPKYCECPQHPYTFKQFKHGNVALTGGPTGAELEFTLRKPCEELISAPRCDTLLPEFGPLITSVGGKSTAVETRNGDSTDSACTFLYKGKLEEFVENEQPEKLFVGVIAPVVNVLRAGDYGGAIRVFEATSKLPGAFMVVRPGIGEEAVLYTRTESGPHGPEYISSAVIRVRNVVASYSLLSTNGNAEASPRASLALLEIVAHRL